jgi:hypothetical protein
MTIPSLTAAERMRTAIARDQTSHWRRLFWEVAPSKKELNRRESMWFWWGSIGWQAEMAARHPSLLPERGYAHGR